MSTAFKAIRIRSLAQFDNMMHHLILEVYHVRDHREFWVAMEEAIGEYSPELNQTPAFWNLTGRAHRDAVVLRLARLYDPSPGSLSLGNILQTIKENISSDSGAFPPAIADLSIGDLDADLLTVSQSEFAVKRLLQVRNEYLAHRDTRHAMQGNYTALPVLESDEIIGLLTGAIELIKKYHERLGYPTLGWSQQPLNDFRRLLVLLREGRQANS